MQIESRINKHAWMLCRMQHHAKDNAKLDYSILKRSNIRDYSDKII